MAIKIHLIELLGHLPDRLLHGRDRLGTDRTRALCGRRPVCAAVRRRRRCRAVTLPSPNHPLYPHNSCAASPPSLCSHVEARYVAL